MEVWNSAEINLPARRIIRNTIFSFSYQVPCKEFDVVASENKPNEIYAYT